MIFVKLRIKIFLILIFSQFLFAINAPYSYSYTPKFVYKNQIFAVTVMAKHYDTKKKPVFEFDPLSMVQPIEDNPVVTLNKDEAFFTFYFKAKSKKDYIDIPALSISTIDYTYILKPIRIKQKELDLSSTDIFSGVLASNFRIDNVKIDNYDDTHNLVTLTISAVSANLEDMHILNVSDDGVENIKRDGANVTAKYYFVIEANKTSVPFSYYDLIKRHFVDIRVDLNPNRYQMNNINLAPKDLTFDKFKKYFLIFVTILFILLYIGTKDKLYIFLIILTGGSLIYIFFSYKTICVKEGANLCILPTSNSNISLQIDHNIKTKLIKKYRNFNKIEYKNKIVGWVKDEDLCKD